MDFDSFCQICHEKSAAYQCPKCQIRYCSLNCYRNRCHEPCSKKFDEREILDSFDIDNASENDERTTSNNYVRERIAEIFKRKLDEKELHNENDDENIDEMFEHLLPSKEIQGEGEGEELDGEERIVSDEEPLPDDIDETEEDVNRLWNCLTAEEKQEFKLMLNDGRISHLLNEYKPWKPWWVFTAPLPTLICDNEVTDLPSATKYPDDVPMILSPIVPLPSLTSILPHVHVRFDVFEILFAYTLINIRYRGDWNNYQTESISEFLQITAKHLKPTKSTGDESEDPLTVLRSRISLIRQSLQIRVSEEFFLSILADIIKIVHGPYPRAKSSNEFVLAALSDLKRNFLRFQEVQPMIDSSSEKNVFHGHRTNDLRVQLKSTKSSKLRHQLKPTTILIRKLDYFLSWTITHADRLIMLERELEQIEVDLRQQFNDYQREKNRIEKHLKDLRVQPSKKIEEL